MNPEESAAYQELDAVLQAERFKALKRVREADSPDRLDLLLLAQWRAEIALTTHPGNRRAIVRTYGPHWGIGAGALSVVIALIEAIGKFLAR